VRGTVSRGARSLLALPSSCINNDCWAPGNGIVRGFTCEMGCTCRSGKGLNCGLELRRGFRSESAEERIDEIESVGGSAISISLSVAAFAFIVVLEPPEAPKNDMVVLGVTGGLGKMMLS
jgi:hypothetical protein